VPGGAMGWLADGGAPWTTNPTPPKNQKSKENEYYKKGE